jgi:hypothetical protein
LRRWGIKTEINSQRDRNQTISRLAVTKTATLEISLAPQAIWEPFLLSGVNAPIRKYFRLKNLATILTKNTAIRARTVIVTLSSKKIFKIDENYDQNIDPRNYVRIYIGTAP